jgi:transposase
MALALWVLRRKQPQLELALTGQFTDHHAWLIQGALELIALLDRQLTDLHQHIGELMAPLAPQMEQLTSIPGLEATAALAILAEIGTEMRHSGSACQLQKKLQFSRRRCKYHKSECNSAFVRRTFPTTRVDVSATRLYGFERFILHSIKRFGCRVASFALRARAPRPARGLAVEVRSNATQGRPPLSASMQRPTTRQYTGRHCAHG